MPMTMAVSKRDNCGSYQRTWLQTDVYTTQRLRFV